MEAIIRPARLDDAEALQRHCYPEHSLDDVRDYLAWCLGEARKGRVARLVVEVDGQAVGNAQLTVWDQDGEIGSLVVGQGFRRRGLAKQLLKALVAEAERKGLASLEIGVSTDQPQILAFYQSVGFHPIQREAEQGSQEGLAHPLHREPTILLTMQVTQL
jgi:ribosomal protein S18 acetylase RimI-like enzyme